jgi:hypothetical protein
MRRDLADTVKAQLVTVITEHWPILDCNEETRKDHTTCACALHGATWQPTVKQSIKEWAEHLAEQIEPALREYGKQKEKSIVQHIKGGALDGCMCDPCVAIRELIAQATADALEAVEQLARDFDDDAVAAAIHELPSADIAAKAKEREGHIEHDLLAQMAATEFDERLAGMEVWVAEHHPEIQKEQKHLDEGSVERAYWHYGYIRAAKDMLAYLAVSRPNALAEHDAKIRREAIMDVCNLITVDEYATRNGHQIHRVAIAGYILRAKKGGHSKNLNRANRLKEHILKTLLGEPDKTRHPDGL